MQEEIGKKTEIAREKLRAMSDALYVACETWDLATPARLAWLFVHHPSLNIDNGVGGIDFDPAGLAQVVKFVEEMVMGVENYADCFRPRVGSKIKDDDEIWEEAQALGKTSQAALDALLSCIDAWRSAFDSAQSPPGKSPSTT